MASIVAHTAKRYKDLDLSFTRHPVRNDVNKHIDEMAVINSLKNLLSLNYYEKPFHPEIGSGVRGLLFENMDIVTARVLEREIRQTIQNFEPRVNVQKVEVSPDFDNNGYSIGMTFYIINRTEPITIDFFLQRDR